MKSIRTGIALALTFALAANLLGCTSRRQYAVNETVLISERRQLEDEIYRVQFELRDALEENERLRAELDDVDADSNKRAKKASTRVKDATRQKTDNRFPGGDALDVDAGAETLPDFVPVPASRNAARPRTNAPNAAPRSAGPRNVGATAANFLAPAPMKRSAVEQASYDREEEDDYSQDWDDDWAPTP